MFLRKNKVWATPAAAVAIFLSLLAMSGASANEIKKGMSIEVVTAIIGEPRSIERNDINDYVYYYSDDTVRGPFVRFQYNTVYTWGGFDGHKKQNIIKQHKQNLTHKSVRRIAECNSTNADAIFKEMDRSGPIPSALSINNDGLSSIVIDNTKIKKDAHVKIVRLHERVASRSFVVKSGRVYGETNISPGVYQVIYRHRGSCGATKADRNFEVTQTQDGNRTYFSKITITLYEVENGNLETKSINPEEFDSF
jgi:hypothetical protein